MDALQIQPHSRRVSGLAVLVLTVLAVGSFTAGLTREIAAANAPSPFPAVQEASPQVTGATPAPAADQQLAVNTPPPRHIAPKAPVAVDAAPDPEPNAGPSAEPPPATDASATAPDPSPPPDVAAPMPSQDAPNF